MKQILTALKSEWLGIFQNRKLMIAIIGVMTIPLLYSGTYLWAFWDPYGHLDQLPVAVVNNDNGAIYNGQKLQIGNDLVKELKKSKSFNWKFVSAKTADDGLKNQKYYLKIEIPKDFSKNATTLQSSQPKKLELIYSANQGSNYLSSKIGDSAIEKIKEEVASSVTKTYAKSMFQNMKDMASGLTTAGSGAGDLSSGIDTAKAGAVSLAAGIGSVQSGAASLQNGANQEDSGQKQLNDQLQSFAGKFSSFSDGVISSDDGSKQLQDGINQFGGALNQLQSGAAAELSPSVNQLNQGAQDANQGAQSLNQGLQQTTETVSNMAAAATDPVQKAQLEGLLATLKQLSAGSQNVADGVSQLAGGSKLLSDGFTTFTNNFNLAVKNYGQITDGSGRLTSGLNQLASASPQFKDGANQLAQGSQQLVNGADQLTSGTVSLNSGMSQLSQGSTDLAGGMNKLSSGSKELTDKLNNGAKEASNVKSNNSVYDMFAAPVKLKDVYVNQVPNYGSGFAPYFLSLSLFVGALMLSVIFPMVNPAGEPKSGLSWFSGKLGVLLVEGLAQALLADFVLLKLLGLEVKSVPYFILLSIFASWTFFAIIQFLVTTMDNPGRFLAVILLVLQLTSSAGTYPIELSPSFLQSISHFMPMTYTVAGFRAIISTGDIGNMWKNIGFESIFFIAFLAATLAFFNLKFKRQSRLLHS